MDFVNFTRPERKEVDISGDKRHDYDLSSTELGMEVENIKYGVYNNSKR